MLGFAYALACRRGISRGNGQDEARRFTCEAYQGPTYPHDQGTAACLSRAPHHREDRSRAPIHRLPPRAGVRTTGAAKGPQVSEVRSALLPMDACGPASERSARGETEGPPKE